MKRLLLGGGVLLVVLILCLGAGTVDYTSYFHNTLTYTNAVVRGAVTAQTGVFTNSLSGAGFATSGTTNATLSGYFRADSVWATNSLDGAGFGTRGTTNAQLMGTFIANNAILTNGFTAAGLATSGTTNATLSGTLKADSGTFTNGVTAGVGSAANPGFKFNDAESVGFYKPGSYQVTLGAPVGDLWMLDGTTGEIRAGSAYSLCWSSTIGASGASDLYLRRDTANTLALRNGTNAQAFNIYNTYANGGTDYERLTITWSGNIVDIKAEAGGTGTLRQLRLLFGTNVFSYSGTNLTFNGGTVNVTY